MLLQVNRQVQSRLKEHFSQPMLTEPVRTAPLKDAFYEEEDEDPVRQVRRRRAPEPM